MIRLSEELEATYIAKCDYGAQIGKMEADNRQLQVANQEMRSRLDSLQRALDQLGNQA